MGDHDPDFPDPTIEARWITDTLRGELLMVPDAGHHPHSQRPDLVGPAGNNLRAATRPPLHTGFGAGHVRNGTPR